MLLHDIKAIFPESRGIEYDGIEFEELFINPSIKVDKGLFVLIEASDCDVKLKEALYNGAIGALWPKDCSIPTFIPNHFPIFLVDEPIDALQELVEQIEVGTFKNVSLSYIHVGSTHNEEKATYDSSVIDKIEKMKKSMATSEQHTERGE